MRARVGLVALWAGAGHGGLEVYEQQMVHWLPRLNPDIDYHVFCLNDNAAQALGEALPNLQLHIASHAGRSARHKAQAMLWKWPQASKAMGLNLVHALFVPPPRLPCPFIYTQHGAEMFERADLYPRLLRWRLQASLRLAMSRAERVICVSQTTADVLRQRLQLPAQKLVTVLNGHDARYHPLAPAQRDASLAALGLAPGYLLSVGRQEPRKNPLGLLAAYALLRREWPQAPPLVMVGRKYWSGGEVTRRVQELGLQSDVRELEEVPLQHMPAVYAGASALVFPSLWEGFGIPVVEAMACGTPVIAARVPCLPEVALDAAHWVDPLSPASIAAGIRRVLRDSRLRDELVTRGLRRAAQLTWQKSALATSAVHQQCLSSAASERG